MPHHMFAVVSEIAGQHQKSFKESQSTRSTRAIMNPKSQLGRNVKEQCLIKSTKDKKNHPHGKMCNLQMERSEIPTVFLTRRQSQELFRCGKRCKPWHCPRLWICSLTFFPPADGACRSSRDLIAKYNTIYYTLKYEYNL